MQDSAVRKPHVQKRLHTHHRKGVGSTGRYYMVCFLTVGRFLRADVDKVGGRSRLRGTLCGDQVEAEGHPQALHHFLPPVPLNFRVALDTQKGQQLQHPAHLLALRWVFDTMFPFSGGQIQETRGFFASQAPRRALTAPWRQCSGATSP